MRIISGKRKGKKIIAPNNLPVRPTTDFAKEALFNIITNRYDIEDLSVLDLYAGTGNISYEFASRGAKKVIAVDFSNECTKFIKRISESLNFTEINVNHADALRWIEIANEKWDVIFADPPFDYEMTHLIPKLVFEKQLLNDDGVLIVEHSKKMSFADNPNFSEFRKYGSICFSFFK